MNEDKMVKVRIKRHGGFTDLQKIHFPIYVVAKKDKDNGVFVHQTEFDVICSNTSMNGLYWFGDNEYELITEDEPELLFTQQQTIEQLLEELAQVNEDGLKLADRKHELLGILNPMLNQYGYKLED
jgi:hypothetical protein